MAWPAKCLITLNPRLRAFGEAEIDRTLRHELAHLLAHHRAGRRRIAPHGPEWQQACRDLGLASEPLPHAPPAPPKTRAAARLRLSGVRARPPPRPPLRRKTACLACCRKHNRGQYDERFRFVKVK